MNVQVVGQVGELGTVADGLSALGVLRVQVETVDDNIAARRLELADEHAQESRLAGAIESQQAQALVLLDAKRQMIHGVDRLADLEIVLHQIDSHQRLVSHQLVDVTRRDSLALAQHVLFQVVRRRRRRRRFQFAMLVGVLFGRASWPERPRPCAKEVDSLFVLESE